MPVVLKNRCPQDHPYPCIRMCPMDAIIQKEFEAPEVDGAKCLDCGFFVNACPHGVFSQARSDSLISPGSRI